MAHTDHDTAHINFFVVGPRTSVSRFSFPFLRFPFWVVRSSNKRRGICKRVGCHPPSPSPSQRLDGTVNIQPACQLASLPACQPSRITPMLAFTALALLAVFFLAVRSGWVPWIGNAFRLHTSREYVFSQRCVPDFRLTVDLTESIEHCPSLSAHLTCPPTEPKAKQCSRSTPWANVSYSARTRSRSPKSPLRTHGISSTT